MEPPSACDIAENCAEGDKREQMEELPRSRKKVHFGGRDAIPQQKRDVFKTFPPRGPSGDSAGDCVTKAPPQAFIEGFIPRAPADRRPAPRRLSGDTSALRVSALRLSAAAPVGPAQRFPPERPLSTPENYSASAK
ncbi:hypothetical protein AAFF_G00106580 [Aldrovandia affinis]|uniref:Uncharacterized protein n=1 Tax=Aldrovandia affinis TaxID=143900 RepID=A0AAD7T428_9TELE|nr:hypothetical protein AAFF_G00106580 [Aldrovandia affinis]